jgi:hypothetical protein
MKQFTFLLGCIFGGILNSSAQTFFATPGPLYEQTVALNQANLCYIYFENPSGDSLHLRWRKLEASMPQGWDADICDYGTCYFGVPNTALMHWVYDTIQPYLKLVVQPGAVEGAAWFWFRVSEEGNTSNFEDVYYCLHTSGVSSVQNPETYSFKVYPNPSNGMVWVENKTGTSALALLSDETGRLLASQKMEPNTATHLTGELLESGVYYLRMNDQTHKIIVQR